VIDVVSAIEQRGAPVAANKALKTIKTFFRWCVGRAVLDRSPADGVPLPAKQVTRDRVLSDAELARVIIAARQIGSPYGDIVEVLALTGQRREEVARCTWDEIDMKTRTWKLSSDRTKNAKSHEVHLSDPVIAVLNRTSERGSPGREIAHFRTSVLPSERSTSFPASPDGDFMICDEPAFLEWQGSGSPLTSPTKY
jgi:integrase